MVSQLPLRSGAWIDGRFLSQTSKRKVPPPKKIQHEKAPMLTTRDHQTPGLQGTCWLDIFSKVVLRIDPSTNPPTLDTSLGDEGLLDSTAQKWCGKPKEKRVQKMRVSRLKGTNKDKGDCWPPFLLVGLGEKIFGVKRDVQGSWLFSTILYAKWTLDSFSCRNMGMNGRMLGVRVVFALLQ